MNKAWESVIAVNDLQYMDREIRLVAILWIITEFWSV